MKTIRTVYLWQNNLIVTIDCDGAQVPTLQGKVFDPKDINDILDSLEKRSDHNTRWVVGNWVTRVIESIPRSVWFKTAHSRRDAAKTIWESIHEI